MFALRCNGTHLANDDFIGHSWRRAPPCHHLVILSRHTRHHPRCVNAKRNEKKQFAKICVSCIDKPVYDVTNRKSFDAIAWWFEERSKHAPALAVKMIVGNKSDRVGASLTYLDACVCAHESFDYFPSFFFFSCRDTCGGYLRQRARRSRRKWGVCLSSRPQRRPWACARHSATSSSASSTPLRYEKFWLGLGGVGGRECVTQCE